LSRTMTALSGSMKYIHNNDIKPLPDLLKKIGEDMQTVMVKRLKHQEQASDQVLNKLKRAKDQMEDDFKQQLLEKDNQKQELLAEWEEKLAREREEKEKVVKEITEQYENKLVEQGAKMKQHVDELKEKIKNLEDQVKVRRSLEQKIADLEGVIKRRDEKIEQLEARNAQTLEELQVTGFNLKKAEQSGADLEKIVQELTLDRNNLRDTSRRQEKKINSLTEEKQKLMARIEKLMVDLESKDAEYREKNRAMIEENTSMTEQLKLLRSQQKNAAEAMEKLRLAMLDMKWKLNEWNPIRLQQEIDTLAKQVEHVRKVALLRTEQTALLKEKNEELQTALLYVERDLVLERQLLPMMHSLSGPIGSKGLDLRPTLGGKSSSSASIGKVAP